MSTTQKTLKKKSTRTQVSEFTHNRFVLSSLVSRDFKLKYRRSILGVLWSVLNPLLMMIVLTAVFSYMFRFSIDHYPLYLILGQILFTMVQGATTSAMTSIIDASAMIKKIRIEKMVFPTEKVLFELVNFAISLIAVVIVMLFLQVMPTEKIILLPVLLLYVTIFALGLGLLLASLAVFFRDVIHLWGVVCTAWMYATPIFYPVEMLPAELSSLMPLNPMWQYITYFRDIFMWNVWPSLLQNIACLGMALITFGIGYLVFRKTEHKFILYV